jgi:YegS/Rv2252/BmrU family lipid kinase
MSRRVLLIANPAAGGGRAGQAIPAVEDALRAHGLSFRTERTTGLPHAQQLAREAAERGEIAAAFGGDGLVGAAAGALIGSDGVLGVLPGGRGNDLARVLGIGQDPAAACAVLAAGVERPIDLGEVDGRPFAGIASCGFDSDANRIANETKLIRGNLVYVYAALAALVRWRTARFELTLDHRTRTLVGYGLIAANSKAYGGGMYAAPGAELDDGQLDVVTLGEVSKWSFLTRVLPKVFKGTHVNNPEVDVARCAELRVSADRPFTLYADGDPIGELPATIKVLPAAVRVLVPAAPAR